MNSRRGVSAALLGLLALVIGVWLGQCAFSDENREGLLPERPDGFDNYASFVIVDPRR